MQVADGFICDYCRANGTMKQADLQVEFSGIAPRGMVFDHEVVEVCQEHHDKISNDGIPGDIIHRITKC